MTERLATYKNAHVATEAHEDNVMVLLPTPDIEQVLAIGRRLAKAIALANERVPKRGEVNDRGQRWNYATADDLYAVARQALSESGISVIPSVGKPKWVPTRETRSGVQMYRVLVPVVVHFVSEDGFTSVRWWGEAEGADDKLLQKAITNAIKYALRATLLLATGDEPDTDACVSRDEVKQAHANVRANGFNHQEFWTKLYGQHGHADHVRAAGMEALRQKFSSVDEALEFAGKLIEAREVGVEVVEVE